MPLRRLLAISAIVFCLLLAFLAGRVRAGADPTQAGTPASSSSTPSSGDDGPVPDGSVAPNPDGAPDGYGQGAPGGGSTEPDPNPPSTFAS